MPMDGLHIILGSGVGVGVIAGVFYLIFAGAKGDREKKKAATHCHVCYQPLLTSFPSQNVVCFLCEHRVCRPPEFENIFAGTNLLYHKGSRCSRFDNSVKKWKCFKCIRNNSTVEDTYRAIIGARAYCARRNSTGSLFGRGSSLDSRMSFVDLDSEGMISEQLERERQRIRVLIEGQAGRMVGGNLDEVKIGRLYAHPLYEQMFSKHHGILSRALVKLATTLHQTVMNLPSTSNASKSSPDGNNLSSAEIGLRDAVRRVAREASRLPLLSGDAGDSEINGAGRISPRPPDGTYEELVATAILNKVIDTFQKDRYGLQPSITPGSVSSHQSSRSNSFRVNPIEDLSDVNFEELERRSCHSGRFRRDLSSLEPENYDLSADILSVEKPRRNSGFRRRHKVREIDDGSVSSLDGCSEDSRGHHHQEEIKQRIGEFTSSDIEAYDNQVESSDYSEINGAKPKNPKKPSSNSGQYIDEEYPAPVTEPWEENWLFQKKTTKNSILSTPVAMLVPKASIEYRALIGDRDADDTTDLSEAGSDYEDLLTENNTNDLKSVLVTSRTLIGGKNDFEIVQEINEENNPPEQVANASVEIVESEQPISESYEVFDAEKDVKSIKNKIAIWDNFYHKRGEELRRVEDLSNTEFTSLKPGMKENLLEAKNSHLLDSQCSESSSIESHQQEGEYSIHYDSMESKPSHPIPSPRKYTSKYNYDSGIDLSEGPPMKGTIAEREHKKWENAVPMPNNPYTPENIEKRLSQRSSSIISLPQVTALERRNSYKREIEGEIFVSENKASNVNGLLVAESCEENNALRPFDKSQSCTNLSEGKTSSLSRNGSSCSIGKKSRLERDYYINDPESISRSKRTEFERPTSVESFYDDEKGENGSRKLQNAGPNGKDLGDTLSLDSSVSSYDTINSPTDVQLVYNFNSQVITICKPQENLSETKSPEKNNNNNMEITTPNVKSRSLIDITQFDKKPSEYSIDNNTHSCVNLTKSQINCLPSFIDEITIKNLSGINKLDKEVEADLNDSLDNLQGSDYEDTVESTPQLAAENAMFEEINRSKEPIPSVKERLKCFLNPKFIDFDQDNIKPNHSITARSIFRRSNNTSANNPLLIDGNNSEGMTKSLLDDMCSKTLKERREFFENLNK